MYASKSYHGITSEISTSKLNHQRQHLPPTGNHGTKLSQKVQIVQRKFMFLRQLSTTADMNIKSTDAKDPVCNGNN